MNLGAILITNSSPKTFRNPEWILGNAMAEAKRHRKRASKHASALRLLYTEDVDADEIAATIKERGGIQKLANEAAKPGRKGPKKRAEKADAEASAQNGDADDPDLEENGDGNEDAGVGDVEEVANADQGVRFSISDKLTDKIRSCRGKRIKIIAVVPGKMPDLQVKVLKVVTLKAANG
jgi:hypothetical protein